MNNLHKGILLTLISTVLNASTYIITKVVLNYTNAETALVLWFIWGTIIFSFFFLFSRSLKKIFGELKKNAKKMTIFGIISAIGIVSWTYGILYGNPTSVAFIFRLEAIFTIIFGLVLLKEKVSNFEWVGIFLAIVGAFIMVYKGGIVLDKGTISILVAAFSSALSIFLVKVYVKGMSAYSITYARTVSALLFISAYALALGKLQFTLQLNVLGLTLLAAFVGAFLGMFLLYKSLSFYGLSKVTAVKSTEPFFVATFSLIFLLTVPGINEIIGGTLIVGGVILLSLAGRNKNGNTKNTKAK